MIKKRINAISLLLSALIYIALGITTIIWSDESIYIVRISLAVFLAAHGGLMFIRLFTDRSRLGLAGTILLGLINFAVSFILLAFPPLFSSSITFIFGLWMLINTIVRFIVFWQYRQNHVKSRFFTFLGGVASLICTIILLAHPYTYYPIVINLIGIYAIFYGGSIFMDFLREIVPRSTTDKIKRHMRFSIPTVIAAFIPKFFVTSYNHLMEIEQDESARKEWLSEMHKNDEDPEMEVFIHTGDGPTTQFGHIDVFFEGKIYSYGSYDESSQHLWAAVGDGVLFTATDKEAYLKFCIEHNKKTIVSFGVNLTPKQVLSVRSELEKIFNDLTPWQCDAQKAKLNGQDPTVYKDYASALHNATGAVFYKFLRGRFKSYFVMGTNCVMLADRIIGSSGSDVLSINGIITPGVYYTYLNKEFLRPMGMVVTRTIYSAESFGLESMHKSYRKEEESNGIKTYNA